MNENASDGKETPGAGPALSTGFHEVRSTPGESALSKYQMLVVGSRSLGSLLLHEMLTTMLTNVAGLCGIVLRRCFYRLLFKRMERGVIIGQGVTLRQPGKIEVGPGCLIDDYASLGVRGSGDTGIVMGREVFIGRGSVVGIRNGRIELGDHTNIGGNCRLGGSGGTLRTGSHVLIGAYSYIGGGMHRCDRTDIPMALQGQVVKGGVTIGDDVWIGGGCHVLDGVTIGRGAIIGAGSVVTHDLPDWAVAYGSPARVQRTRRPE
jgi:acetyltransferase-like isoleucine patch superfamily enzyme